MDGKRGICKAFKALGVRLQRLAELEKCMVWDSKTAGFRAEGEGTPHRQRTDCNIARTTHMGKSGA